MSKRSIRKKRHKSLIISNLDPALIQELDKNQIRNIIWSEKLHAEYTAMHKFSSKGLSNAEADKRIKEVILNIN